MHFHVKEILNKDKINNFFATPVEICFSENNLKVFQDDKWQGSVEFSAKPSNFFFLGKFIKGTPKSRMIFSEKLPAMQQLENKIKNCHRKYH